jgi:integrase
MMWTKLAAGMGADGHSRPTIAATTLKTRYVHLNAALRAAVKSRHVPLTYNPAATDEAKPERGERREIHPLTEDEVRRLFAVTKGERHHALFVTLITTGIRHGEAQALRWQDIDVERRTLSICRTLHHEPDKGWVAGPTKTRKNRQVALPAETVVALKAHRARQAEMRLLAGPEWQDTGLVFTTERGTALHQNTIQLAFDRACERAGISRRTVKETRHTFATLALINRVPVKIVSEALGHASVAVTYDIYSHVIAGLQEDSMVHLNRLFS